MRKDNAGIVSITQVSILGLTQLPISRLRPMLYYEQLFDQKAPTMTIIPQTHASTTLDPAALPAAVLAAIGACADACRITLIHGGFSSCRMSDVHCS